MASKKKEELLQPEVQTQAQAALPWVAREATVSHAPPS